MIYTIGHSNHREDAFLTLLRAHEIGRIADIRTTPHSRRHPQFNRGALAQFLQRNGIAYRHLPALGGLRKPQHQSVNTAWQEEGFRGYADYMRTATFRTGVEALLAFAQISTRDARIPEEDRQCVNNRTAVMCAEAAWWECHRQLLADALLVAGVPVRHILPQGHAKPHQLGPFAKTEDGKVIYPGLL